MTTGADPGLGVDGESIVGERVARPLRVTMLRPWRGPAPDPESDPEGARAVQQATARYVAGLFAALVLLQRFATPGQADVSFLVPLVPLYAGWGMLRGIVEIDRSRLLLWLAATGSSAVLIPLQQRLVQSPIISLTGWGLLFVVWLPAVVRVKDRRAGTYLLALRSIAHIAAVLAIGCLVFIGTQLAGIPYTDYLAQAIPSQFLLHDFVITYPIVYASSLYRANAWIGLEPSFVSMQLGIGLIAAFLSGTRLRVLVVIIGGIVGATAGSGLAIVAVAFAVMMGYPVRNNLVRYLPLAVGGLLALVVTPFGQSILARLTEAGDEQSSTSLRGILPYTYVWPQWVYDPMAVLLGRGPSSSQKIVGESGILGLLTPTPLKIFVEYGLVVGLVIAGFILFGYVGGPSRSLSVTLLVSLWMLQPGTTTMVAVLPLFITTTWWAPRVSPVLESDSSTFAAARSWVDRAARWRPLQGVATWRLGRRVPAPPARTTPTMR
jgi:hypothetical protein